MMIFFHSILTEKYIKTKNQQERKTRTVATKSWHLDGLYTGRLYKQKVFFNHPS